MKNKSWKFFRFFILFSICTTLLVCVVPNPSYAQTDDWLERTYLTELLRSSQGMNQVWQSQPVLFPEILEIPPFPAGSSLDLQGAWTRPWEEPNWEQGLNMEMDMQQSIQPVTSRYSRSIYQQSDITALPGRTRNMLFDFAYQIPGQNQIPGMYNWPPSQTPITRKQDYPVPDIWSTSSTPGPNQFPVPDVWQTFGSQIVWGLSGASIGGYNGLGSFYEGGFAAGSPIQ